MPYVIAIVIIIVAAGALLLFRQPAEAPTETEVEQIDSTENIREIPEGFTPPTTPPPGSDTEAALEVEAATEVETTDQPISEAESNETATYTAEASYFTPKRTEHEMLISLTLEGETITAANIDYDGGAAATPSHASFDTAYKAEVIGMDINEVQLSRVGGASLTSTAYNEAVADIRAQL